VIWYSDCFALVACKHILACYICICICICIVFPFITSYVNNYRQPALMTIWFSGCCYRGLYMFLLKKYDWSIDDWWYTVSGKDLAHGLWFLGDIRLMPIFVGVRWWLRWYQMRVRSSKMRVFSFDRYIRMKFPTGFTYRNLHGFARFPCDSRALVKIRVQLLRREAL